MTRFGVLLLASCFQPHARADDAESDSLILLQARASVENDHNSTDSSAACHCTTPGQGTSGRNQYKCNNGQSGYCASNQVCYAEGSFNYGDWGAACASPDAVICQCATPGQGTSGKNKYNCQKAQKQHCGDGWCAQGQQSGYCASDQTCYATGSFNYGDWDAACAVPSCTCNTPNAGTSGHNQYTCNDGTSAWCASDQVCYATGSFTKGNWQLGCQVTCNCDKAGTLHHVTQCEQCGQNLCNGVSTDEPNVETFYSVGTSVPDWGCNNVGGAPQIVRNSVSGAIYVVEPTGQMLMHVPTCNMCGRNFCDSNEWSKNGSPLLGYAGIDTFTEADCNSVGSVVRDTSDGAIYAVKAAPEGQYRCTDGSVGSCPQGGGCPATGRWLKSDIDVGCPAPPPAPPNKPPPPTTTTTTPAEAANQDTCQKWCYSKKHASQPWCGGKCSWQDCGACDECDCD